MNNQFRAYDKKSKKMRRVHCIVFDELSGDISLVNVWGKDIIEDKDIILRREPKDVDLMQYIGEIDCNKKRVFKGDLVKFKGIWYTTPYWAAKLSMGKNPKQTLKDIENGTGEYPFEIREIKIPNCYQWFVSRDWEIIGSIHDKEQP